MALQSIGRPGCSVRRTPLLLSWMLCCLLVVTACSSGHPRGTAAPTPLSGSAKGAVTVPVTAAGALATTASWQVRMAATTSAGTGATLTIAPPGATAPAAAPPAGLRPGSDPARFELVGAQLGSDGAMVTRKLSAPVPADQQASLAYFDEKARAWVSVPTKVSADRRQLTANTGHFSIWDDIYYGIGAGITKRADAPSCWGSTPSWVQNTTFFDDLNAPLQWCAGRDPKNPQWLVVKVVASRAYGFLMRPAVTPQWTYSSFMHDIPGPVDLITNGVDQALRLPDTLQAMRGGVFLAPGAEVDFGFTEQQVRSLKTSELVSADPSITWMLAGSMYSAVSAVIGKDNAEFSYAFSLVAALQCARDLVKTNSAPELSTALVACLVTNADDFSKSSLKLAQMAGANTAAAKKLLDFADPLAVEKGAPKISVIAEVSLGVAAASVGAQIGEWLADQSQPPESRALSVSLNAAPTTSVTNINPLTSSGALREGWSIAQAGSGDPVDCSYDQGSPSAVSPGTHRCGDSASMSDACWTSSRYPRQILCLLDPFAKVLHARLAVNVPTSTPAASLPQPLGVELYDGTQWRLRVGGSWGGRADGLAGAYSCSRGAVCDYAKTGKSIVILTDGGSLVDTSTQPWTVKVGEIGDPQINYPPPKTVKVRKVLYVSTR